MQQRIRDLTFHRQRRHARAKGDGIAHALLVQLHECKNVPQNALASTGGTKGTMPGASTTISTSCELTAPVATSRVTSRRQLRRSTTSSTSVPRAKVLSKAVCAYCCK